MSLRALSTGLVVALAVAVAGCSGSAPESDRTAADKDTPAPTEHPEKRDDQETAGHDKVVTAIRNLLPEASGMPVVQFTTLAASATAPRIGDVENQSLSMICLAIRHDAVDADPMALEREFKVGDETVPKPSEFARLMSRSKDRGFVSVVHSDEIDEITCKVSGDEARGEAAFHMGDVLRARVEFVAERVEGEWAITRFALPTWGVETVRGDDSRWTASGVAIEPGFVSLPVVHGLAETPDRTGERLVVEFGSRSGGELSAARLLEGGRVLGRVDVPEDTPADAPRVPAALAEALKREVNERGRGITVVVRADRGLAAGTLRDVVNAARELGVESFAFAVRWEDGGHHVAEIPMPLPAAVARTAIDEELPPIRVSLRADERGEFADVRLGERSLGGDDRALARVGQEILTLTGGEFLEHVDVEIDYDDAIRTDLLLGLVATCRGHVTPDGPRRFVRRVSILRVGEEAVPDEVLPMEFDLPGE